VGDSPKAYERFVYLYAHAPGYRDEKALQRVVEELGNDNPHAVTAMALSACEPGSAIDPDDVHRLAQKILEPRDLEYASHSDAYLLLCCGKLALAKQDFDRALEYFDKGDKAYPQGSYSFRRAELHLCRADAFESLGDLWKALQASGRALVAAHEQVRLESDNPQWARLERKATERRAELEIKNFQSMQIPER
jgi:tetratricopeptide (TPR) repeat protein